MSQESKQQVAKFWVEINTPYGTIKKHYSVKGKRPHPNKENVEKYLKDMFNQVYKKTLVELDILIKKNDERIFL